MADHEFDNAEEWQHGSADWMSAYTRSLAQDSSTVNAGNFLSEKDLGQGSIPRNYKYVNYVRKADGQVSTFGELALQGRRTLTGGPIPSMPLLGKRDEQQQPSSSQKSSTRIDSSTDTATLTAASEAGAPEAEGIEGFDRRDNDGDKMERSGLPPNGYYQLPVGCSKEMTHQFFGPRNKNIFHIADKTNTHIAKPTNVEVPILEIWGKQANVETAKGLLRYLQIHVDKDIQATARKAAPWAKVKAAPTTRKRDLERKREKWTEMTSMYRKPAPMEKYYRAIGCFSWPAKEFQPSVLGMNYEALDPIRFECEVFIIWSPKRDAFRVLGDDPARVNKAIERLYIVFCELAVKNRNATRIHLVVPPAIGKLCADVALKKNVELKGKQLSVKRLESNVGVVCNPVGQPSQEMVEMWPEKRKSLLRANETYLRKAVAQAIKDISYIRGHAKMRIYFGRLVLFAYRRPKGSRHALQEFMDMMHNHQTAGEVIRSIGSNDVGVELIKNCDRYTDRFLHVNPHTTHLGYPEPFYCASFDILLQDEAQHHLFVKLEVEFEPVPGTDEYRATTRRWLEIKKDNNGVREDHFMRRRALLDIKYLDLDSNLAYQFEVIRGSYRRDTDIYPIFGEFVQRLRLDPMPDAQNEGGGIARRVSYTNLPGMTVDTCVQKTKHQYWMSKTSYIFEITKYEYIPTGVANDRYGEGVALDLRGIPPDVRYGASLYSCHWDSVLSKQTTLDVGTVGNWKPDLESFFKNYGVGGFGAEPPAPKEKAIIKTNGQKFNAQVKDEFKEGQKKKDGFGQLLDRVDYCVEMIAEVTARTKRLRDEMSDEIKVEEY